MPVESSAEDVRTCESGEDQNLSWDRFSDYLGHLWVLVLVGVAAIAVYPLIPIEAAQQALFWIICASLGLGVISQVAILVGEGIAWIAFKTKSSRSVRTWTSPFSAPPSAKPPTSAAAPN